VNLFGLHLGHTPAVTVMGSVALALVALLVYAVATLVSPDLDGERTGHTTAVTLARTGLFTAVAGAATAVVVVSAVAAGYTA